MKEKIPVATKSKILNYTTTLENIQDYISCTDLKRTYDNIVKELCQEYQELYEKYKNENKIICPYVPIIFEYDQQTFVLKFKTRYGLLELNKNIKKLKDTDEQNIFKEAMKIVGRI